ncbi:MAG: hypothetical protein K0R67_2610 [Paenibacillus sp.]|nr:hypothetical protein [Paenibacillus sp.]
MMLVLLTVTACGADQKEPETKSGEPSAAPTVSSQPTGTPQPTAKPQPVDITIMSNTNMTVEAFNKQYGDAIKKKFPHVTVNFILGPVKDVVAAKTPIDIQFGSIGTVYSHVLDFGLQYDLSELIKTKGYKLDSLEPTMVELQKKIGNGKIYGLPVWNATSGLFYNKDLFDKFGQPYPKEGMSWDELAQLSKSMTRIDGGIQYFGYVTSAGAQMATNQMGLDPVDPKTMKSNFTSEPWKQFMQSIVDIYKASGFKYTKDELDVAKGRAFFEKESRVAMYTNYSGGTPPETMNWDVVSVPSFKDKPGVGTQAYPNYWYVTSISQQKETAFDIIAFLTSEEFQIPHNRSGFATVLNKAEIKKQYGQDMPKFKGKNVEAMFPKKPSDPMNYTPYAAVAQNAFQSAFDSIMLGEKDVNTALRDAAEQVDKQIQTKK